MMLMTYLLSIVSWKDGLEAMDTAALMHQRRDARALLGQLIGEHPPTNSPAFKMWSGYEVALSLYGVYTCSILSKRLRSAENKGDNLHVWDEFIDIGGFKRKENEQRCYVWYDDCGGSMDWTSTRNGVLPWWWSHNAKQEISFSHQAHWNRWAAPKGKKFPITQPIPTHVAWPMGRGHNDEWQQNTPIDSFEF